MNRNNFLLAARTLPYFLIPLIHSEANTIDDPSCPCLKNSTHLSTPKTHDGTCLESIPNENTKGIWSSYCYPLSYGNTCAAHDKNLEPFCNDPNNKFDFCDDSWCYVDPSQCKFSENNTYARSDLFPHLFNSYTTCGAVDKWEFDITLKGKTLRVGVPALFFPDHYKLDANGKPKGNFERDINSGVGDFHGIFIDLLNDIASRANFMVQYESVSIGSIKKYKGDLWTACVQDVARGLLDMCIGNFWENSPRRQIAQFSTSILNDRFYMIVPLPREDDSFGAQMSKLFQPFSPTLWLTIILTTIGVGFSYTILSINSNSSMKKIMNNIVFNTYRASMELMGGATFSLDQPIYLKNITLAWGFFLLIIIAAYTANLTAFLSDKPVIHRFESLDDCIEKNCNLCFTSSKVLERIKIVYPSLRRHQQISGSNQVPLVLANRTCDTFILSKNDWDFDENYWGNCETMFIGDFVAEFKVSWPISSALEGPISYWLAKSIGRGTFHEILENYRPVPRCHVPIKTNQNSSSVEQIGCVSMAGPFFLLVAGVAFGLFCKLGKSI